MSASEVISPVKVPRTKKLTKQDGNLILHLLKGGRLSVGEVENRWGTASVSFGVDEEGLFASFKYEPVTDYVREHLVLNENGENFQRITEGYKCNPEAIAKMVKGLIANCE